MCGGFCSCSVIKTMNNSGCYYRLLVQLHCSNFSSYFAENILPKTQLAVTMAEIDLDHKKTALTLAVQNGNITEVNQKFNHIVTKSSNIIFVPLDVMDCTFQRYKCSNDGQRNKWVKLGNHKLIRMINY